MRVLVTGSAGFIGRATCFALFKAGHQVASMLDRAYNDAELQHLSVASRVDIRERRAADILAEVRPEAIIHLAAQTSLQASWESPLGDMSENVGGTVAMLEAARTYGCRRFVFASTSAVYSPFSLGRYTEDDLLEPQVPYGVGKLASEHYVRVLAPEAVILRYGNVYGPGQKPKGENLLFARAIQHLAGHLPGFVINGDGSKVRDFVYVDDVARANVLALTAPPDTYNIGGWPSTVEAALGLLLKAWLELVGHPFDGFEGWMHGPEKPGELDQVIFDIKKAARQLRYEPQVRLEDGLRKMVIAL